MADTNYCDRWVGSYFMIRFASDAPRRRPIEIKSELYKMFEKEAQTMANVVASEM